MPQQRADQYHRIHVIGCGALVRELRAVFPHDIELAATYLPAPLHNRPERIVPAIDELIDAGIDADHLFIAYGDCGTGGGLDRAIDRWRRATTMSISRLPGDHCYEFFTGSAAFADLHSAELGTLFLTDYLTRHFDLLIWQGLGLADHPELLPMYFGHYTRVVHLSQTDDPATVAELDAMARAAAAQLGLQYERHHTGLKPLASAVSVALTAPTAAPTGAS